MADSTNVWLILNKKKRMDKISCVMGQKNCTKPKLTDKMTATTQDN